MRIPDSLKLIALVSLAALPTSAAVAEEFRIGPSIDTMHPRAPSDRKPGLARAPVTGPPPENIGPGIKCAAASDLCAWKRIPGDPNWRYHFPPVRP